MKSKNLIVLAIASAGAIAISAMAAMSMPTSKAANRFHEHFTGASEGFYVTDTVSYVERYNGSHYGLVAVNTGASDVEITLSSNMGNGSYANLVSGATLTVSSRNVTVPAGGTLTLEQA